MNHQISSIRQHPLILPVYLPTFLLSLAGGILIPVLPLYLRNLDAGYGLVGLVLSGQSIGMLVGDLPSGMILRRVGQRKAMIFGFFLLSLATIALFWSQSVFETFLYRLFSGVGISVLGVARHAYITDKAVIGIRGRTVALFGGINRIGRFSGPALGGIIGNSFSLNVPFLFAGGLIGLAFVFVLIFVPKTNLSGLIKHVTVKAYFRILADTIRDSYCVFSTAGIGMLLAQMVRTGRGVMIPLYGADVLGLDVVQIGWISSLASAVDMLLFYPVGMIMDRFGRKFAIVPSFFIQGLGLGLIPITSSIVGFATVASLIGFGNGLSSGTMMTLGSDLSPEKTRGEFLGIWRLIGDVGFSSGPLIAGAIAGALALPAASLVIGASGIAASLLFAFLVPETIKKAKQ